MRLHSKSSPVLQPERESGVAADVDDDSSEVSAEIVASPAESAPAAESAPVGGSIGERTVAEVSVRPTWASTFPHAEIDELMIRVAEAAALSADDVMKLLAGIVDEAKRLRATVVRLTSEKLSAAEQEAEQILRAAREEAAQLRRSANEAMVNRLDDAESASTAVRHAAEVDARRRSRQGQQLLASTRAEVEELRARVSAIFDSTNGILPLLGDAAESLRRMEETMSEPGTDATATVTATITAPSEQGVAEAPEQIKRVHEAAIAASASQQEEQVAAPGTASASSSDEGDAGHAGGPAPQA